MKLISCHIDAFGKFNNVDFDFKNLTVICQNNGYGKTTLAQFVKAMFYSLPPSSKKAGVKSERDLYRPFNFDGKFGGRLTFECEKGRFVAVRMFSTTPTLDKFMLFDAKTNLLSNEFSSNLGEELFGVGRETFENSTFFGQQNLVSGINDDIRARLSTGVLSGDDVDNFEKAQEKLQKKMREIRADMRASGVDELKEEKERLLAKDALLKTRLKSVEDDLKEAQEISKSVKKQTKNLDKNEITSFTSQKIACDSVVENNKGRLELKQKQLDEVKAKTNLTSSDVEFLKNDYDKNLIKRNNNLLMIFATLIVLGVAGLVVGAVIKNMILIYVFAGVVLVGLAVVIYVMLSKYNHSYWAEQYHQILERCKIKPQELEKQIEIFEQTSSDVRHLEDEILQLKKEIDDKTKQANQLENDFKAKYGCWIEEFSIKKDEDSYKLSAIEKKIVELENDKKHYVDDLENIQSALFDVDGNIAEKLQKLDSLQKKYEILLKTCAYLDKAKDDISNRYVEPVSKLFDKYYKNFLADGESVLIDSNLNMKFGSTFSDVSYLSAGLFDLVYICKRFALIDLLYKKEKPILILDDPFANFDDEKLEIAKSLVQELSKKYQILLFTCQKSRA